MSKTGIFYHRSFSQKSALTVGRRLADFPQTMEPILQEGPFVLYESRPVSDDLILKVHTPDLIREVERDPL